MTAKLSHLDDAGRAAMVDVSEKHETARAARAEAFVVLSEEAYGLVVSGGAPKGDVLATARIAGIMAAKKTSELIPLCHPLALTHVSVAFTEIADRHAIHIVAAAKTSGQTGVEMEALTAASIAALTVYDMVKGVDKSARIESIRLLTKSGGKSGAYDAESATPPPPRPRTAAAALRGKAGPPRVLLHETGRPREPANPQSEREALRAFMLERHLRATEWARDAGVPVNEIYGFLNGRARALAPASCERLAAAARTTVADMLGRKARP